jgi:signal transduction histidine kinase
MKISYFILLGFLLILVMFSITTYMNFRQAEKVNENSEFFATSTTIVRHSNRFQRNILNMISGLRGYLSTGENFFIQAYDSAALENQDILKELSAMIPDSSVQKKSFNEIQALNNRWIDEFAQPLIDAKKTAKQSDSSLIAFNTLYHEKLISGTEQTINRRLQTKFRDFSNYEYNLRDLRKAALDREILITRNVSFYLTTVSVLVGFFIAVFLAHRISTRIVKMVRMADEIARGNYSINIEESGKDELSGLARSLNHMAQVLSENISLLKRKNEELDQFAHIVSHDMKAPLRGIDNVITWIEEDHRDEISPKVDEYIQLIKGRLARAENLIRGILTYARIGKELQEREPVDLNLLMEEIKDTVSIKPGIRLNVQRNMPVIFTERVPLHQILSNLVGNAIKYHDKTDGEVKVYFNERHSYFEFFVEDNGPGIANVYHEKIFVIFQTLMERDSFESTGVGLAIVKKILDDRRQKIKVISEPGKGSIFMFTWPKESEIQSLKFEV